VEELRKYRDIGAKKAHTRGSIYIAACRTVCAIALCRFDSTSSGQDLFGDKRTGNLIGFTTYRAPKTHSSLQPSIQMLPYYFCLKDAVKNTL